MNQPTLALVTSQSDAKPGEHTSINSSTNNIMNSPTPTSPFLSRTQSKSSDRDRTPSVSGASLAVPPPVSPAAAYIAASAAAHVVHSDLVDRDQPWPLGDEISEEDAVTIAPSALALLNSFLDQLLYSFLASSRSTSILSLRPAIAEILKPRLAKEAIEGADEELRGYLAGGDDEELLDFHNGQELKAGSNLHSIFRRTRLRCMVYTRLGDMEEEDEETYLGESAVIPDDESDQHRLSRDFGNVSPAAAIFLTSIIEFLGEQSLIIAGDNAYGRVISKSANPDGSRGSLVVEDRDVEKIAFNKVLGRLWRSWRKKGRLSSMASPRLSSGPLDIRGTRSGRTSRATSISEYGETANLASGDSQRNLAATIVLPEEDGHVEGTGASKDAHATEKSHADSESDAQDVAAPLITRHRSMIELSSIIAQTARSVAAISAHDPDTESAQEKAEQKPVLRTLARASSMPSMRIGFLTSVNTDTFTTPTEGPDPLLADPDERKAAEENLPSLTNPEETVPSAPIPAAQGVRTIYDGVLKRDLKPIPIDPNLPSRGVSMSEYSEQSLDPEMTPQALKFSKPEEPPAHEAVAQIQGEATRDDAESRASTMSSNYSFQIGQQSPLDSTDDVTQTAKDIPTSVPTTSTTKAINASSGSPAAAAVAAIASLEPARGDSGNLLATVQGDRLKTYDGSGKAVKRDIPVLYEDASNEDTIYSPQISKHVPSEDRPVLTSSINSGQDIAHANEAFYGEEGTPLPADAEHVPTARSSRQPAAAIDTRRYSPPIPAGAERAAVQRVLPASPVSRDANYLNSPNLASSPKDRGHALANSPTSSGMSNKIKGIIGRDSGDLGRQSQHGRTGSGEITRELTGGTSRSGGSGNKEHDFEQLIKSDETIQYTLTPQNMREMENPGSPRWTHKPSIGGNESSVASYGDASNAAADQSMPSSRSMKSLRGQNGLRSNPTANVTDFASPRSANTSPTSPKGSSPQAAKSSLNRPRIMPRDAVSSDSSTRDFADFIRSTGPDVDPRTMAKNGMSGTAGRSPEHLRQSSSGSQSGSVRPTSNKMGVKPASGLADKPPGSSGSTPRNGMPRLKARDPIASPNNTTAELADFFRSGPPVDKPSMRSMASPQPTPKQVNGRTREGNTSTVSQDSYAPSKMTQSSTNSKTGLLDNTNRAPPVKNHVRPSPTDFEGPQRKQRRVKDPYAIDSDDEDEEMFQSQPAKPPMATREEESLSDFLRDYSPPAKSAAQTQPIQLAAAPPPTPTQKEIGKTAGTSIRDRLARNIAVIPDYRPLPPKTPKKMASQSSPQNSNEKRQPAPISASSSTAAAISPVSSQRGRAIPGNNISTTNSITSGYKPPQSHYSPSSSISNSTSPPPLTKLSSINGSNAPQIPPINSMNPPLSPGARARATSPHLTQNGTRMDTYRPTQPTYSKQLDTARRPRQQLQARDDVGAGGLGTGMNGSSHSGNGGSSMADLADFLRETEPPAPSGPVLTNGAGAGGKAGGKYSGSTPSNMSSGGGGGGGGFGGIFGRKKKVAYA